MNRKLFITVCMITVYAILIGSFVEFHKENNECSRNKFACIRFCSSDSIKYSDEFLLEKFKKSKNSEYVKKDVKLFREAENVKKEFKVFRGVPTCGGTVFLEPKYNESSDRAPYSIEHDGIAMDNLEKYNHQRYCLEEADDVYDGWKLFICDKDVYIHRILSIIIIILSITLYGFVLFVYSYNKDLRDFHRKWTIILAIIQIFSHLLYPFSVFDRTPNYFNYRFMNKMYYLFELYLMMIILWINVMIFHSFLTFKNFNKDRKTVPYNFSIYAFVAIAIMIPSGILLQISLELVDCKLLYLFIATLGIVVWIFTTFNVYRLSKNPTNADHEIFRIEKKWNWICFEITLTIFITWFLKSFEYSRNFSIFEYVTSDLILLFGAITVTVILIERKKVRNIIFRKNHKVADKVAEESSNEFHNKECTV
ncbi:uncharacterized protein [Chironomus tepperi]|uniref:uncharacterized protein n=1 Tax=Chironomus tepperi TaxID=113505 RepID=UPI00391F0EC5